MLAEKNERIARAVFVAGPSWEKEDGQRRSRYWSLEAAKLQHRLQELLAGNSADGEELP
ncbi:hypothetical protein OG558_19730 [Kribbella sp. NBC_01510]|uniref:hypothetical protein n=1 Tax=Kribbella sp. NBC_01510 TaxID=2903581 RepID=UPI00386A46C6